VKRNETPSTDDNMAPADFKLTGRQVATPHKLSRDQYALLLRQIVYKMFKGSVSTITNIYNVFFLRLSHYYDVN